MAKQKEHIPAVVDPDKPVAEVPDDVYNFYRYLILWRKVNLEMVAKYRIQIRNAPALQPLVQRLCILFLRTGDLSVSEEDIHYAKIDIGAKSLRIGEDLDNLWKVWYDDLCNVIRVTEPTLPTINR